MVIFLDVLWIVLPVAGFVIALLTYRRNPRRSIYAMVGFGAFAFNGVVTLIWTLALLSAGWAEDPFLPAVHGVLLRFVKPLVALVGWVMILLAMFKTDRYAQSSLSGGISRNHRASPGHQDSGRQYPGQPSQGAAPPEYPGT